MSVPLVRYVVKATISVASGGPKSLRALECGKDKAILLTGPDSAAGVLWLRRQLPAEIAIRSTLAVARRSGLIAVSVRRYAENSCACARGRETH
jgi:hypothetical protein